MRIGKLFVVFLVLGCVPLMWAQPAILHVPGDAPTIQAAIGQASSIINGPTPSDVMIRVEPGTYQGPFNLSLINSPNYSVTLFAVGGPTVTRLERPDHRNWVLNGGYVQNFTLDGFHISNRSLDPLNVPAHGINVSESTNITIQNCSFDVSRQAMQFYVSDPAITTRAQVINNFVIAGDTNETPDFLYGQGASINIQMYDFAPSMGDHRLTVTGNTFRTAASAVRFINQIYDAQDNWIQFGTNGSLEMVGNDVTSWYGAGHNMIGGHQHYVAGNRMHDGQAGPHNGCGASGTWENNLIENNVIGAKFGFGYCPFITSPITGETSTFRNNTVVNNKSAGFIYLDTGVPHDPAPVLYNNIFAFNDYSGVLTVLNNDTTFAYMPYNLGMDHNDVYGNTLRGVQDGTFISLSLVTGTPGANYSGIIPNGKDLMVNPMFYDSVRRDFSLKKNSPLVNAGLVTLPVPLRDYARLPRDAKPDIGAFEYVEEKNLNVRSNPGKKGPKTD